MHRIVLDTNVIVSAVISEGKPRALLNRGIENRFSLVTSEFILKEAETVLRRPKFRSTEDEIQKIVLAVMQSGDVVKVKSDFRVIESGPSGNMILNTAYDGHADFIVTRQDPSSPEEVQEDQNLICVKGSESDLEERQRTC